jgi:hypothetical protein
VDTAAGLVTTLGDLHVFGRALFRGDLLASDTQRWLMSVADDLEEEPSGSERLAALRSYHRPYGVLVTAEGDGPGGAVTLLAHHPDTGTIIVAFTNVFGHFDEAEFLQGTVVPQILEQVSAE